MKKAKILGIILILILSISMVVFASGKDTIDIDTKNQKEVTNVKISLNGKPLDIPTDYGYPFIDNQSRTMIPLRIISERLGHKVEWDNKTRTASIDNEVFITIGQNVVKTKNGTITMDTKAILKDGRTYVPLRFVVEALSYEVKYDGPKASNGYNHMVDIFKEGMTTPEVPTDTGDGIKIKTESGTVVFNPETDVDKRFGKLTDEKATELIAGFHNSMKLNENKDSIKIVLYKPDLPADMKFNTTIMVNTKDGKYLSIYETNGKNRHITLRDDGYIEVNYNETHPSDIEYILVTTRVNYKGNNSLRYITELKTGKEAIGEDAYLFD
ncbi:stalk domain-containing protein [Tissierella praeacuta]|uniref:stalk domain-containing protein n=1 Tax=Tissierella praeacuta TaxID=43131 RepID=UPI00334125C6